MGRLPDHSIDMVLTDLPYSFHRDDSTPHATTQNHWDFPVDLNELWSHFRRIVKPNAAIVMTATSPFSHVLAMSNLPWLRYEWVFEKTQGSNFLNSRYQPLRIHENILIFCNGTPPYYPQTREGTPYRRGKRGNSMNYERFDGSFRPVNHGIRMPTSILRFDRDRERLFPTQKPVALCEYLISTYTTEGGLVLDCCMGSGTTAIAALNTGRNFRGV
jgi:site-specific DNA-methyltransferase (adenine-specific)